MKSIYGDYIDIGSNPTLYHR